MDTDKPLGFDLNFTLDIGYICEFLLIEIQLCVLNAMISFVVKA